MTTFQESGTGQHTIVASLVNHGLDYAVTQGLDRAQLLHDCGLTLDLLADPERRLPLFHAERLVEQMVADGRDPLLPLNVLRFLGLEVLGVVGHLMLYSVTLGEAIELQLRYRSLNGDFGQVALRHIPGIAIWSWDSLSTNPVFFRFATEFTLGLWTQLVKLVRVRDQPALLAVHFRHSAPDDPTLVTAYEATFGCPVFFSQDESALLLQPVALRLPLGRANASLQATLEQYAKQQIEQRETTPGLADRVRSRLRLLLRQGIASRDLIAGQLHMSARNLSRQLRQEGNSYRDILNDLRFELAQSYLKDTSETVENIAQRLNFQQSSSFIAWFRALAGCTPGEYQRRIQPPPGSPLK